MLQQYGAIAIFLVCTIAFGFGAIIFSWLISPKPKKGSPAKYDPFECGMETIGPTWVQFRVNYFILAMVFLVFDVETVFLYPWAMTFRSLGFFAFAEMFIFLAILVVGFWYAWKEGAFDWS